MERKKILIVEDDAEQREALRRLLVDWGYDPLETWNGEDAIRRARRDLPSAILLDIRLPTISGLTVAEVLKASRTTRDIPIIAISALSPVRAELDLVGVTAFLPKPVDVGALGALLTALAGMGASGQRGPAGT